MLYVYFEYGACSELVAMFPTEELYMLCLPALESAAKQVNATVSEVVQ